MRPNALVVAGAALVGFIGWIATFWLLAFATGSADSPQGVSGGIFYALVVAAFLGAVGLLVWPRTRRIGQGFLLGIAIGFVVGGGVCLPLLVAA